jgi:hypothetical protein
MAGTKGDLGGFELIKNIPGKLMIVNRKSVALAD